MALSESGTGGRTQAHDVRLPYLPSLDGLRAFAVVAVLLYHAGTPLLGGYIGVEIFFVLSGFLITALLVAEWLPQGQIDLGAFWVRRARRLLPALAVLLACVLTLAATMPYSETASLGGDMLAALGYVMNWRLIISGQSYFDPTLRPPLLQHLWSLAVEEQFYLLWPLFFVGALRLLRPLGTLLITLALAAASFALAAMLYDPGADPSRIYYGTDTRAGGVLLGAALALVWAPWRDPVPQRRLGIALDGVAIGALAGLVAAAIWLVETHPLLYRGGFFAVALLTVALIAAITHPATRLVPALLAWRPLRWLGERSYALYLWHWPVFMLTRPYQDLALAGWPLLLLRLTLVLALATLSYRLIELPVRRGALGRAWRALHAARGSFSLSGSAAFQPLTAAGPQQLRYQHGGPSQPAGPATVPPASSPGPGAPRRLSNWLVILVLLLASGACASLGSTPSAPGAPVAATTPTPAPVAQDPSVAPERTGTPTASASPADTPTVAASATAEPSATSTPDTTATAAAAIAPLDPALAAELQRILDQTVADGSIPGAVLAVSLPGQETWLGASGILDRDDGTPISADTRVRIASISKIFTAVVVLQLAEERAIDLDAPVATYLPDLVPNGDTITVRNLLQHTSGLYDFLEDRNYINQAYGEPERAFAPEELVDYAARFPVIFAPGSAGSWDYSSTNYVVLGMIVEQVTGNSLGSAMRARIFEPLGLGSTYFTPEEPVVGQQASGYARSVELREVAMSFGFATANIVSTVEDLQLFAVALFSGDLLEPASREQMLTFVGGKGQYNMPELAYGLGVMRNVLPVGPDAGGAARPAEASTVIGHIGGFGGFRSALWHAPTSGITIALGVNQGSTDPNILATQIWEAVLDSQER